MHFEVINSSLRLNGEEVHYFFNSSAENYFNEAIKDGASSAFDAMCYIRVYGEDSYARKLTYGNLPTRYVIACQDEGKLFVPGIKGTWYLADKKDTRGDSGFAFYSVRAQKPNHSLLSYKEPIMNQKLLTLMVYMQRGILPNKVIENALRTKYPKLPERLSVNSMLALYREHGEADVFETVKEFI